MKKDDLHAACEGIIHRNQRCSMEKLLTIDGGKQLEDEIRRLGSVRFSWHLVVAGSWDIPACRVCGNNSKWLAGKRSYALSCSRACSKVDPSRRAKRESTLLARYGVRNVSQYDEVKQRKRETTRRNHGVDYPAQNKALFKKQLDTMRERHGVEHAMQREDFRVRAKETIRHRYGTKGLGCDAISNTKAETNFERYGTKHPSQNRDIKDQKLTTMRERWGVDNPSQHPDIQQRKSNTFMERYGVPSASYIKIGAEIMQILLDKDQFSKAINGLTAKEASERLNVSIPTILEKSKMHECRSLLRKGYLFSSYEEKILGLIGNLGEPISMHDRTIITPNELDFYLPTRNLAIEVGSAYFHSECNGKDRSYHYSKWKRCTDRGIVLLQLFDDDLHDHWDLTKSKILRLLGKSELKIVGARALDLAIPTHSDERRFLNQWHSKGWSPRRNHVVGAWYEGKMVAIMTIHIAGNRATIERYASDISYSLPGCFSRMLKYWAKLANFHGTIETWSDNRLGDGKVYSSSGFASTRVSAPGYWYFKNGGLENRVNYQRHKLQKIFNLTDVENRKELTEFDIMKNQGYSRLWDAGHTKWIKEIP